MNRSERQHREDSRLINRWGVILAGGDGTRLRSLTRTITGDGRPKQFCPLIGGQTLLDQTRARISEAIPERQTVFVVTKSHETFYQPLAATVQSSNYWFNP
jgi:mannose-1-phosphate guanylyltransferase